MAGGKGKSSGGKSSGGKTAVDGPKKQQSHSARAGLQVRYSHFHYWRQFILALPCPALSRLVVDRSASPDHCPSPGSLQRKTCTRSRTRPWTCTCTHNSAASTSGCMQMSLLHYIVLSSTFCPPRPVACCSPSRPGQLDVWNCCQNDALYKCNTHHLATISASLHPSMPSPHSLCYILTCLVTVPMRSCEAFPEAEYPGQDARRSQSRSIRDCCPRIFNCRSPRTRWRESPPSLAMTYNFPTSLPCPRCSTL